MKNETRSALNGVQYLRRGSADTHSVTNWRRTAQYLRSLSSGGGNYVTVISGYKKLTLYTAFLLN